MRTLLIFLALILALNFTPTDADATGTKPFTATAVQTTADAVAQGGKIFVSDQGTRFEFSERGRDMVQIILHEQKIMRILFPKDKVYMEIQAPADTPVVTSNATSPCPPIAAMTCKKLSVDKFGDLDVERWHQTIQGQQGEVTLWWEPRRKMIVRQEFPDGRIMQLQLTGESDVNGRKTESWDISYAQPGRPVAKGLRLVDRELGIIVKEQSPTGLVRELRDLKAVSADPKWFTVPDGYQKIEPPKPATAPKR